uniref:Uncharacterized protein n=1 Tax=Strongyloides venezuelensis TaxID=75913 RepID=A0A0K0F126_STRVS
MKLLLKFIIISKIFFIYCQNANITLKDQAYDRVTNHFSEFLLRNQVDMIVDYVTGELYNRTNPHTIGNNLITKITLMLTAEQYGVITAFGIVISTKLGLNGITNFIEVLKNVSSNNLDPLMYQIQNRIMETKAEGYTRQESINDGLYYILTFFSDKRFITIACRIKKHFNSHEWSSYYPAINQMFMFHLYNDKCVTSQGVT